ncbi:hypothetical protein MPRM_51640 [Mycobacterium parmense]|uniref:PE domain-containing protein n=2 Tax=Mycobacterium parmense TaxID=185642 RepID=A0A7I7Z409_9MYCO|nr:hypothetical protein MPRM_51640 [Mycobacterium parmense]
MFAAPESITTAAADLANIGSAVSAAHMAAATPTTAVIPAAADEVSSGIAQLFSQHAQGYQALAGQAAAFQEQFVQHLTSSASAYVSAEAANAAALLQPLTAGVGSLAAVQDQLGNLIDDAFTIAVALIAAPFVAVLLLPLLGTILVGLVGVLLFWGVGSLFIYGLALLASLIPGI